MIRYNEITDSLFHLVGWEQSYDPQRMIADMLTQSDSGLTFQGAHPLMTLENVRSIMPEDWTFQYSEYDSERTYSKGDKMRYRTNPNEEWMIYVSLSDGNKGHAPDELGSYGKDYSNDFEVETEGKWWGGYSFSTDYFVRLTQNGIKKVVQTFIRNKKLTHETHDILVNKTFFDGSARIAANIAPTKQIVGFEVTPVRSMGVTMRIDRIGMQFYGNTGHVHIYVFHSSKSEPYAEIDCLYTMRNGSFMWFAPVNELYLPYIADNKGAGGSWYIVYDQMSIPDDMRALKVSKDWSKEPCGTCNIGSLEDWREMTKYVQVSPFRVPSDEGWSSNPHLWDLKDMVYTVGCNWGLNMQYTIGCDLTDFIIRNKQSFADVLQKQVAYDAMRTMAMNPETRVNRNQINVNRNEILYELDGNLQGHRSGLGYELEQSYSALGIDTKGLDRVCLTCHTGGVHYGVVR